jgi:N-acetylmuramoyl-L-alanine amidase
VGPSGTFEKDRTLEIALLVRDILNVRMPQLNVVMTRDTDEYVSLGARTRLANENRADLFLSIHCNAATNSSANGFETFFLSRARTDDSRAVEMLENSVVEYDEGPEVYEDALSFLLADIAQNIYLERSSSLAVSIQRSMERSYVSGADRGVKQAGFYVLRGALMPSVLIEVAFISNPSEEQLLKSLDFRLATAEAIVDAVLDYTELQ